MKRGNSLEAKLNENNTSMTKMVYFSYISTLTELVIHTCYNSVKLMAYLHEIE